MSDKKKKKSFFQKYIYEKKVESVEETKETKEDVVIDEEVATPVAETPAAKPVQNAAPVVTTPVANVVEEQPVDTDVITGMFSQEMMDTLEKTLFDNKPETPGYLTFKEAIVKTATTLSALPEMQRYQQVFSTMSVLGMDRATLLASIEFFQAIIGKEKEEFAEFIAAKLVADVTSKETEIDSAIGIVEDKKAQIAKLQEEIEEIEGHIKDDVQTMKANEKEIKQLEANFNVTVGTLENGIQEDLGKIQKYIADPNASTASDQAPATEGEA